MTEPETTPPEEQAHDIDAYLVYAAQLYHDSSPRLVLEPSDGNHEQCARSRSGCRANLLDERLERVAVPLGELVRIAVDHADARDGYAADREVDDDAGRRIGEIIGSAQYKALDDLRAEGRAEIVGRLAALRGEWAARRQEAIHLRETVGGRCADIAGAWAGLYSQVIAQLDRVVGS
ncbi:hypothetical protein [Nonomuraea fuscirosea]|uniref:hypothetical protein n=1 Tax=Nonomuraea fuscirosea TaxID=1291556 RepID=UPI0033EB0F31